MVVKYRIAAATSSRFAGEDASICAVDRDVSVVRRLAADFHAASGAPLHMLLGEQDHYAGTESCKEFGEKFRAAGGKRLTLKVLLRRAA